MVNEQITTNHLHSQLSLYHEQKFTGRLDIQITGNPQKSIYLDQGNLIWTSGGIHPLRRWRRQLTRYCPRINYQNISLRQSDHSECWDYQILTLLAKRRVISGIQMLGVMQGSIGEVLFDVWHNLEGNTPNNQISIQAQLGISPGEVSQFLREGLPHCQQILGQVQRNWQHWTQADLQTISPNLAPVIRQSAQLRQQTSARIYKTLINLINGQRTLRDLAMLRKQDVLSLTKSLLPYIKQNILNLVAVPDLQTPVLKRLIQPALPKTPVAAASYYEGLVACIDDSPQVCHLLEELLKAAGYQFLAIQDATQVLPTISKEKPDVIFLKLNMPIANGYELCAQLRRLAELKETPIIFMVDQKNPFSGIRAKLVGVTDFISQPLEPSQVLGKIRKHYIRSPRPVQ